MTEMKPLIGEFHNDRPIKLTPTPNGGWVIEQHSYPGETSNLLGAYTDTADMLAALSTVLEPFDKPELSQAFLNAR